MKYLVRPSFSADPDTLMLRMGEYDLGDESDELYTYQVEGSGGVYHTGTAQLPCCV